MIGWGAIGYLLEWASLRNWESVSLLVIFRGFWQQLQRGSVSFRGDLASGLHFCGLGLRPHTCDLGQNLMSCIAGRFFTC